MKNILLTLTILLCGITSISAHVSHVDSVWFKFTDRMTAPTIYANVDSITFPSNTSLKLWKTLSSGKPFGTSKVMYSAEKFPGEYHFGTPVDRFIVRPSTYGTNDFNNEDSQWCFARSAESDHFILFWEKGLTKTSSGNISYGGYTCNVNTILKNAETIWKCYVEKLGFLEPGNSITDRVKIEMFIVKNGWGGDGDTWRADGSGVNGSYVYYEGTTRKVSSHKVGTFHCTPRAATARSGHTIAHEIGHTFQYLVSADLGTSHGFGYGIGSGRDNEWWEDCANWQAYKVYPSMQYTDGEYYELFLKTHHLSIHHENIRYNNCFYQDYWCQLHGMNTIARIWRESISPEDPCQAYMRIFGLDVEGFADEMYDTFAHLTSIDIDATRNYGKAKIGYEPQRLKEVPEAILTKYLDGDNCWWIVDPDYCPQNYGYNANPLQVPAAGTEVKATFKGLAGCDGYNKVKTDCAGWRYGIVAYCSDGTRVYSDMGKTKDGEVSLIVPENCKNMWFVVMGAPTEYWAYSWTSGVASTTFPNNNEQWPYAVRFEGTDAYGASKTYGAYPDDYERKDTTVVLNANLAYSSSTYSSVRVQYDMGAISKALGVSTEQMKAVKRNTQPEAGSIVFAGLNTNGTTYTYNTTTSTSSNTCYGHWFNSSGNVVTYGGMSAIFAELYPDSYGCYVGQYPAKLTKGKTYVIRQAFIYTHTDGKQYKAIMEVHLTVS